MSNDDFSKANEDWNHQVDNYIKNYKKEVLDAKSPSFCGAKWYNASMWLNAGWTTSCFHNPPHMIDLEAIKTNPKALHNTPQKKKERAMMQKGEKPSGCQACWVMEEVDPDNLSDRVWQSTPFSNEMLHKAFVQSSEEDYALGYLEVAFDKTCQFACSYCSPSISSSWSKDIKKNGVYPELITDHRRHYTHDGADTALYGYRDTNPYVEAFFKWWDSELHSTITQMRITGGEPLMSGHVWRLFDWLKANEGRCNTRIEIATNLGFDDDVIDRLLEKLNDTTMNIWIYTSGESVGAKAEYVRDGLNWEQWHKNVNRLLEAGKQVSIMGTLSALTVDGVLDFLKLIRDKKIQYNNPHTMEMSLQPVRFPTFQSILVLPYEMRMEYSKQIQQWFHEENNKRYFTAFEISHVDRYIKYLEKMEVPHREFEADVSDLRRDFKVFFDAYDKRRGKNFVETFPNYAEWYRSINR